MAHHCFGRVSGRPAEGAKKIAASSDIYFITENGKPILDIRPFRSVPNEKMRGSVLAEGDIVSPIEADGYASFR